jgi:hypothetical protein
MKKFILSLCLCIAPALCINVQAAEVTKTKQVCVKKKCKQVKMHKKHVSKKVTK